MALIKTAVAEGIGTLALDNYTHRNALSAALIAELVKALTELRETARVVVLRVTAKNPVWSAQGTTFTSCRRKARIRSRGTTR